MKSITRRLTDVEQQLKDVKLFPAIYKGKLVLFDDIRVKLPENSGLYKYEIRSDDDGEGIPCELSSLIAVNFYGTIISDSEIDLPNKGWKEYDLIEKEEDFNTNWYQEFSSLDLLLNKNYIISTLNEDRYFGKFDNNGILI